MLAEVKLSMYENKHIAVVIPAYNEEAFITQVIYSIPTYVDWIVVVDDCSRDATTQKAQTSGDPRVVAIRHEKNQGVGGAMITGYGKALELNAEVVVKVDGDGQMSLEHLPLLLDAIIKDGYAYAKGNRFMETQSLGNMPKMRLLGNIALTFLTKLASGYWHIFDPQNGYTAIDAHALKTINLAAIYRGYFFENDMLIQLNIQRYRVKDVPIPAIYGEEKSDLHIPTILFTFSRLLLNRFFYRVFQKYVLRDFSPIVLFGLSGLFFLLWGGCFGIFVWVRALSSNVPATTGTVMLSILPFLMGFQLLLQAIVLDIQETPR